MTDAGSIRSGNSSIRSTGSSKYRKISSTSSVDQSLFGSSRGSPTSFAGTKLIRGKSLVGKKACISSIELQQIKESALSPAKQKKNVACSEYRPRPDESESAKARKEYMKGLELKVIEDQRKIGTQSDNKKLERIRKQAQEKIVEEEDIVKLLTTCSDRATTFAIRDQQLKDKAEREKKEQDFEQRMILAMEIDRLREIEAREVEEEQKVKKMIEGRKIIENQIEERLQTKLLMEEAHDQENRKMLERIKIYKEQDDEKARKRKENAAKAREEIIRANEEHIASKREQKLLEKREEEMMVAYQIRQDEKLRQREAEEEEAEQLKREIQKKLLDEQERTMDRRSEIDELRARRAVEDAERKYRQQQLIEAEKRKRAMDSLDMARKQQQQEKHKMRQMEMLQKQDEYQNAIKHARVMAERERSEAERVKLKNGELITNLQKQIEENSSARVSREKEKHREGALIKQKLAEERAKLESVRGKLVHDMKVKGIDERYFGEITSLDIGKYLMK